MKKLSLRNVLVAILSLVLLFCAGAFSLINGVKAETPFTFNMKTGASIRVNGGTQGIRFGAELSDYDEEKAYGFVIVPKYYLVDNNITENYVPALEALAEQEVIKDPIILFSTVQATDNGYEIMGSISNILYNNINLEFTGIAFEYDGTNFVYANFNSLDDISRTAPAVAVDCLNDLYYNADIDSDKAELYTDNKELLESYIDKSLDKKAGLTEQQSDATDTVWSLAIDEAEYDFELGQNVKLPVTANVPLTTVVYESDNADVTVSNDGVVSATEAGTATITVKTLGLTATSSVTFDTMEDGYLATFSNIGYEDSIAGGAYSGFWKADAVSAEYVASDVVGAKDGDAVKVTVDIAKCRDNKGMSYFIINSLDNGVNLVGDTLLIRFKATYNNGENNVDPFGYIINGQTAVLNGLNGSADVVSVALNTSEVDNDGWRTLSIATSSIPGGVESVESLGLIFYQYVGVDDGIGEIYLDYVKLTTTLATPTNLAYASGTLTWDAVANATSYVVTYGGQEYPVNTNSMEVPAGNVVKVKAVAEGFVSSNWSAQYAIVSVPEGYIADYNSSAYEGMIEKDSGDGYWASTDLVVAYQSESIQGAENGDAMKLTASLKAYNATQGIAAFKLIFPTEKGANLNGDMVQVRFHAKDGANDVAMFLNYINSGTAITAGLDVSEADADGWRILSIPVSKIAGGASAFNTLGIAFWPYSTSSGTVEIYVDYVKVVSTLPTIDLPAGYLADYNSELYNDLIKNGHNPTDSYWASASVSAQYVASDVAGADRGDAMMLTLGVKGNNRTGFQMKFVDADVSGTTVQVRLKAKDGTADVPVFLFSVNDGNPVTSGFSTSSADADGWRIVSIPISAMGGVTADGITSLGLACYSYTTDTTTATVYIDWVKVV